MPRPSAASLAFPNVTGTPTRLSPPVELASDERQTFIGLVSAVKADHFKLSDLPLLCAYCRSVTIERRAATELSASNDPKALSRWSQATKAMVSLSMRLRLSPQARAPHTGRPTKPERPLSIYEKMAMEGDDADGD
jgi:phage terminase small subunit